MPSLRIDQSDLKCKNGCNYFGNPQWQGYCSKCHREQLQRQRRAEKASSATLPPPEQKRPERALKLASQSFSKFEEKRLRQSETLKKALKFSVFKKSSTDEQDHTPERKPPEFKIPAMVNEGMKREFRVRFPMLPTQVDRDARVFVHSFIMDVIKCSNVMNVDELSERVQRHYQHFMKYMDTSPHFANAESETKELLIDFVEKHAMTYLHDLPGVVFSPSGTEDERLDRAMSERIQQLSWVGKRHLECKLDRANIAGCQPLYKAISELLAMDGAPSPGGKLTRVRRACRHVLALCGAPASADDLLPALIFTVLKANPPRLVSNINFVTRFCNAQRLMTGEGGYYFTNLCCAVSFIENLTAESLNMDKKEFDCYMAMPASIGGSTWAAALSLCGAVREADEQKLQTEKLMEEVKALRTKAHQLAANAETFEKEIAKKVQDVLAKTPLEIKPRRIPPRLASLRNSTTPLIDLETPQPSIQIKQDVPYNPNAEISDVNPIPQIPKLEINDVNIIPQIQITDKNPVSQILDTNAIPSEIPEINRIPQVQISDVNPIAQMDKHSISQILDGNPEIPQIEIPETKPVQEPVMVTIGQMVGDDIVDFQTTPKSPKSPHKMPWELKHTGSFEILTPSPLGFTPFDSRSIDELMTPDEFGSDLAPGLSNINYDIDLSDFSGDNSLAEDLPKPKDPFSPDGIKKEPIFDPFSPQTSQNMAHLEKFDEFSLVNPGSEAEAFEVVHRQYQPLDQSRDPFSPVQKEGTSILDDSGSPTAACLLPSPLLPQTSKQS
ncbi:rab5 GDP/GTP exchange factor isoform X2 [Maniola jurtina]|nr:rab5 GDP/GTP exchange factor isoform X2 [Maniola jurtina]XP_045785789.1 rab5 GDP/GTP exchange factor isoform X2 [Maniola jurtina]XP_045785790.1 rab5 GDP/GTP exchange factor isoform X2 [Maniola jurtina]